MSQKLDLFRLQKIDTRRDQIATRLQEIERILRETQELVNARDQLNKAETSTRAAQKALQEAETAVHSQHVKIEQDEASLYGGKVRNPKELQDLQNEVASLKRYLAKLEDQQLEAMLSLEENEARLTSAQSQMAMVEERTQQQHSGLIAEKNALIKDLERLDSEHQATSRPVSPESLMVYENLRKQKRGLAVTQVDDCTCTACGATLTPSECQVARSPSQISLCPSCGRILYAG